MAFAPRMTQLIADTYEPVDFGSQALFALVNLKERIGPCVCECPEDSQLT